MTALRICFDRILPPRCERLLNFELPPLRSAGDNVQAMSGILAAVAAGEITLSEALEVTKLVELSLKALEVKELDERLNFVEGKINEIMPLKTT